jgi:hypothetical protein
VRGNLAEAFKDLFGGETRTQSSDVPRSSDQLLGEVFSEYPALRGQPWAVIDSRNKGISNGRRLEFYDPREPNSPVPGRPTVEIFDPSFQGEALRDVIAADMLHFLPQVNEEFGNLRERFRQSITPEQLAMDQRAFQRAQQSGERRPFEQWFEQHRLDQYIGAILLPRPNDWIRSFTEEQNQLSTDILNFLKEED